MTREEERERERERERMRDREERGRRVLSTQKRQEDRMLRFMPFRQ